MITSEDVTEKTSREIKEYEIEEYILEHKPLEEQPSTSFDGPDNNIQDSQTYNDSLTSDASGPSGSQTVETEPGKLHFTCGNPEVQTIHGIIHFYNDLTKCGDGYKSDLVCILAVPTIFNLQDILSFLGPYTNNILGIRIIKDRTPNSYMALMRFVNSEKAEEFYLNQQDQPFNSLDDALCHMAFVSVLEFGKTEIHLGSLAAGPLIELPQCAVCLERMDESTTGMLTVLCNHTFHCECMTQCSTCPVCRYFAVPPEINSHSCLVCGKTDELWLCLICGYVGCGRYKGGHARGHFERTNHTYSMDVEERCVWDYIGDNYVHRLIQNKTDGKLVAVGQDQDGMMDEKLETLTLEYSYLLTQQLESQREFFEKKLSFVEEEAMERLVIVEGEVQKITEEKDKYKEKWEDSEKERKKMEKKLDTLSNKYKVLSKELSEERELNKCLQENQREWIAKVVASNSELKLAQERHQTDVTELREQIKDLMFHIQSQATITSSSMKDEIQSGEVHMVPSTSSTPPRPSRRSPRKKK